jgi:hypothetical protein
MVRWSQAFHVTGTTSRVSTGSAYTHRQRDIGMREGLRNIYTPQAVLNGKDWPSLVCGLTDGVARSGAGRSAQFASRSTVDHRSV